MYTLKVPCIQGGFMSNRSIKNIYPAYQDNIADLHTVRPLPSPQIQMLDPFLFLNHHGPQVYKSNNNGLPFGPHPHRGFQTVTFIIKGDIAHKDSGGHESVIGPGGVQWMSAGRGLIHEEISSEEFKKTGGPLEILQLWINLPAKLKMSEPYYKGLQGDEIPVVEKDLSKVQMISGTYHHVTGPFKPSTDITSMTVSLKQSGEFKLDVPKNHTIFFYVVQGRVSFKDTIVDKENLVDFNHDGAAISFTAAKDSLVLICHALPYNEPVAFGGPFVMNTREEIKQAMLDYQNGKF